MKIKRLEICGFKSFVDRTVVVFPDPITAIVGPNGCGKSNIVDSIRWCMGEQSAKHLRGRAMEDVIFAGSESRGPASMAEVSLTFDAGDLASSVAPGGVPWGEVNPSEITVTRRLYRDGTSEYLLGGVPCRLRDIVDFFLGTGVGTKAYSIIEQGRVGFIVSSKPEDRRTLIDEAAGITKYKAKKKQAERRMESTRQHLLRVSDIIAEIETRLRSLRLQAQKAERYKKYRAELRELELWEASHRYLGLLAEEKTNQAAHIETEAAHEEAAQTLVLKEADVEVERLALSQETAELSAVREEILELGSRAQLANQRAQHYEQESQRLAEQSDEAGREIESSQARIGANRESIADLEGQLESLAEDAERSADVYSEQETIYEGLREELHGARQQVDEANRAAAAARTGMARDEAELESTRARRGDLAQRLDALIAEKTRTAEDHELVVTERIQVEERLAALTENRELLAARRGEAQRQVESFKEQVARGGLEIETLREEAHRRRSRLQSLQEIAARYESFERGVKAIMRRCQADEPGEGAADDQASASRAFTLGGSVRGLVADIVQPPPELEPAVEAVLGQRLGNVIVESHEVGVEAIQFLKERSEGRSSFIPLDLRSPMSAPPIGGGPEIVYDASGGVSQSSSPPAPPVMWPTGEGIKGPLLELIGYDRQYDKVAAHLLGDVVVVDTLDRALSIYREGRVPHTLVTLDGETIDAYGVVTGGSRDEARAGVLSQKREIRELEELVAGINADLEAATERHISLKQELAAATERLAEVEREMREAEMAALALGKDQDRLGREADRLGARVQQLAAAVAELHEADARAEQRLQELVAHLEERRETAARSELEAEELRQQSIALGERLDELVKALTELKVTAAQAGDRRKNAELNLERLRRETEEHERRVERLQSGRHEQSERAEVLRHDALQLREEAALQLAEAEARTRVHAERQESVEQRSASLAAIEEDVRRLRSQTARLAEALTELSLRLQEAKLKRTSIEEHIADRYRDARLSDLVFDYHLRAPIGAEEQDRMEQLRGLIERMGEINLTAIEESEEYQKRFDFLSAQKADLESAIEQLETAITKINKASKKRFMDVYEAVNNKFQEVFPHLFRGGKARLVLTNPDDPLETGVEIIANPPGKKISQNLELLSGGEKALTAVSLLFAIFLVKPSPFCILDEVDAPLDDVNVTRFCQGIREMTDRSQFIVITHNKQSMEIADRLCGVTMEEPGVSKLVAVQMRGPEMGQGQIATKQRGAEAETAA